MLITAHRTWTPIPENYWFEVGKLDKEASEARVVDLPEEEVNQMLKDPIEIVRKKVRDLLYKDM